MNNNSLLSIYTNLFTFSLCIYYVDSFKLSKIPLFRYIQIISFIFSPIFVMLYAYDHILVTQFINCVKDNSTDTNIHLHGHVSIDRKTGETIGQGVYNIGSNIGLGASVAVISGAVAKGISKASIPPMQKAGIIMAGGVIGGVVHTIASTINHNNNIYSDNKPNNSNISSNNVNNLIDLSSNTSPIEVLLQSINILSDVSLALILILSLQLFYKFIVQDKPKLAFLDKIFPNFSDKIRTYVYKLIKLNKNMNIIYMILVILLLIIAMCTISYTSLELVNHIDKYVQIYTEYYKK